MCLDKNFLKYHPKDPTSEFDKKLYTRYAKELNEEAEAIYNIDEAIDIMKQHQNNNNIFIILQDGAVPDKIREQAWNKWILNEFDDKQRSLFSSTRLNINNDPTNNNIGITSMINHNNLKLNSWTNESIWLRIIVIINFVAILGYLCLVNPTVYNAKLCCLNRRTQKIKYLLKE